MHQLPLAQLNADLARLRECIVNTCEDGQYDAVVFVEDQLRCSCVAGSPRWGRKEMGR